MTKGEYSHLSNEQRNLIEHLLNKGYSFSDIGKALNLDRTTISKEVRRNYSVKVIKNSKQHCINQNNCGIAFCNYDKQCYKGKECDKLSRPPYVCNSCTKKVGCRLTKHFYFSSLAQQLYEQRVVDSKKGYDIKEEDVDLIERVIVPLVKDKKQPINHIYENHKDILFFSKPTFYRYVRENVISLSNIDLPKQVSYKPRNGEKNNNKDRKVRAYSVGRTFDDFISYTTKHPNKSIVEMDTVEGIKGGKCFLTLFIRKTSLLLIFLLDKKTIEEVNKVFIYLRKTLGIELYKKIFQVILTDNGSEFLNPIVFERDLETGKKVSRVYYCDPYSSWQKSFIENSHKRIRIVLPKGTSFNNLSLQQVNYLRDNIANLYKDKIKMTPYLKTEKVFPDLIKCLNIKYIEPNNIDLSKSSLKEVNHEE